MIYGTAGQWERLQAEIARLREEIQLLEMQIKK